MESMYIGLDVHKNTLIKTRNRHRRHQRLRSNRGWHWVRCFAESRI